MHNHKFFWLAILFILYLPLGLYAWTDWQTIATKHFTIFYKQGWEVEAANVLQTMELNRPYVEKLIGNHKTGVPITLEDLGNITNGYTDPFSTKIGLFTYPPMGDELALSEDWWQLVGVHEYIHMLQMTEESDVPMLLRIGFSNFLYPLIWQPGWLSEGITVYGESQFSPYTGRLNGGTYNAMIASLAKENKLPSLTKASYNSLDTPVENWYVFGASFFDYLMKTYGEDKFAHFNQLRGSSLFSYVNGMFPGLGLDRHSNMVYGKSLSALWKEWLDSQAASAQSYRLPSHALTSDGWSKAHLQLYNGELYYTASSYEHTGPYGGFQFYQLKKHNPDNGEDAVILTQAMEFPAGYAFSGNKIFYTRQEIGAGFANNAFDGWGGKTELWQCDLTGTNAKKLYQGNFRAFCALDADTVVLSEDDLLHRNSALVRLELPSGKRTELLRTDYLIGRIVPVGEKLYLTARFYWKNNSVFMWEPGAKSLVHIVDTPYLEDVVSADSLSLIYLANYGKQVKCYRLWLHKGVTEEFTGSSDIRSLVEDRQRNALFCISLDSRGYNLYQLENKSQVFNLPADAYPEPPYPMLSKGEMPVFAQEAVTKGTYWANLKHLAVPRYLHIPIVQVVGDSVAVGLSLTGTDVVGDFPGWDLTVLRDFKRDKTFYEINLTNNFLRPLKHTFFYSNLDEQTLGNTLFLNLYARVNYGLNGVQGGLDFTTKNDYARKIWKPFTDFSCSWEGGNLFIHQSLLYENKRFLPSDRNRMGWQGWYLLKQRMPLTSELRSQVLMAVDAKAERDEVFGRLKGYTTDFSANQGATLQASWYKPILRVREGLWNPQIYMEDISAGVFGAAGLPLEEFERDAQLAGGVELIAEMGTLFMAKTYCGIRCSLNRDGKGLVQLVVNTDY